MTKATFGNVRTLPSGRFQARYTGPDGQTYTGPVTFVRKGDATTWLAAERVAISKGTWVAPPLRSITTAADITLDAYVRTWVEGRRTKTGRPLAPKTREHYLDTLLAKHIGPTFGHRTVRSITRLEVRQWHAKVCPDAPVLRSHAYGFLRTVLNSAVDDEVIDVNPANIKGAATVTTTRKVRVLSDDELVLLVKSMPERLRAMVLLGTWTALRFGELAELRRGDVHLVDDDYAVLRVRRAVSRTKGAVHRERPKTDAGVRDVTVPPHIIPVLVEHLREHTGPTLDALLFPSFRDPSANLHLASLQYHLYPAREAAGRPDLHFHDLRHTGAVLAAQSGATLADLMARLGHTTHVAAMRYQHAAEGRDRLVAIEMSRRASVG